MIGENSQLIANMLCLRLTAVITTFTSHSLRSSQAEGSRIPIELNLSCVYSSASPDSSIPA